MSWSRLGFWEYHEGFAPPLAPGQFSFGSEALRPHTLRRAPSIYDKKYIFVQCAGVLGPAEQRAMDITLIRWVVSLPTPDIMPRQSGGSSPLDLVVPKTRY